MSYEPPTPPFTRSVGYCLQRFLRKQLHCKGQRDCRWRREEGSAPGGVPLSWVTGPGTGRTAPRPNDWLPSKAQGGKFLTAGSVSAESCHWHLIFERWADHGLGEVRATPRRTPSSFGPIGPESSATAFMWSRTKANTMASSLAKRRSGQVPYASSVRTTRSGTNNLPFGQC